MKKHLLALSLCLSACGGYVAVAQTTEGEPLPGETYFEFEPEDFLLQDTLKFPLATEGDTLLYGPQPAQAGTLPVLPDSVSLSGRYDENGKEIVPIVPNELIKDRLSCLQTTIPLTFNPYVRQHIDYFTVNNRKYTRRVIRRQNVYFPLFEKYLAKYNLPQELKYLAVVESALNPKAVSRTKAMGLWQFMGPTANDFRLRQDHYIDDRLDPDKSTEAACKFLKGLYGMFGDWQVALAAYNCGPGNVRKAIKRAGGKVDFWAIFPYLPQETRGYVPSFIALTYAMNYNEEHNIAADSMQVPHMTDTILVNRYINLKALSENICVDLEHLLELNPAIKQPVLPPNVKNYPLRVPYHCAAYIDLNRGWLMDSCSKGTCPPPPLRQEPVYVASARKGAGATQQKKSYYTVKKGDVLGRIADKENVALADLKRWNNIKGSSIAAGQKLAIYREVPATAPKAAPAAPKLDEQPALAKAGKANPAPAVAKAVPSSAEPVSDEVAAQPAASETAVAQNTEAQPEQQPEATPEAVASAKPALAKAASKADAASAAFTAKQQAKEHFVQPGDTLFSISRRYEGVTVEQIRKLNKLNGNEIKVGQKLILG